MGKQSYIMVFGYGAGKDEPVHHQHFAIQRSTILLEPSNIPSRSTPNPQISDRLLRITKISFIMIPLRVKEEDRLKGKDEG